MAVTDPAKVPEKKITSLDITGFSGGLYLNGPQNAEGNQFVESENAELTVSGYLKPRRSLQRWLPPTEEPGYGIYPVIWDGQIYHITADDGQVKYCQDGDNEWVAFGGDNSITTQNGGKPQFLRALDCVLVLNGGNGDKLCYVDLDTFEVVKYEHVDDPTTAPSVSPTGITNSGSFKIYYGYTYSSATGETLISDILTYTINKPRDNWKADNTEFLTITRPGSPPTGATKWNLYIALASTGGTIRPDDMLLLAGGLDLAVNSFVDNGTLAIDIGGGTPPPVNSTDGMRVQYGLETNGRPVLYGDVDNPHNVWIGGDGEYALDFSPSNGGFRAEPSKGTNYYPAGVIGFRNGQGIPSLTILFTNTQGLAKQATMEQQTINYGNQSFVVWGITEQYFGAAGVASPLSLVNYRGQLAFFSTDGVTSMDTQPQLQNVISTKKIDDDIQEYTRRVKTSALGTVVGTAWENRIYWCVPARGFDKPNEILVRDLSNNGAWYTMRIAADWLGTVSPPDSPSFVYIRQGRNTFKLLEAFGTVDYKTGAATNFPTYVRGAVLGYGDAHNTHQALVQAVFYVRNLIGPIEVGVTYRSHSDRTGRMKTKSRVYQGPPYVLSSSGSWSDPYYTFSGFPAVPGWSAFGRINSEVQSTQRIDARIPLRINEIVSEVQWWIKTPSTYCDWELKSVVFEGENLGVKPDLR